MKKIYQIIVLCVMGIALAICGGCSTSEDKKDYKTPADNHDFSAAHEVINVYMKEYEEKLSVMRYSWDHYEGVMNAATLYMDAVSYVYCAETRYLFTSEEENAERRLKVLINEFPHIGKKSPHGEHYDEEEELIHSKLYSVYTHANNVFADCFLDMAISNGKRELAHLALSHFIEAPKINKVEYKINALQSTKYYYVDYSSEEKEAAQKKYDDAVKQGLFSE